jgi:hypothetical protein
MKSNFRQRPDRVAIPTGEITAAEGAAIAALRDGVSAKGKDDTAAAPGRLFYYVPHGAFYELLNEGLKFRRVDEEEKVRDKLAAVGIVTEGFLDDAAIKGLGESKPSDPAFWRLSSRKIKEIQEEIYAILRGVANVALGESNIPGYRGDMDAMLACKPAADYFGLPVEVVERKLREAAAEVAKRETTDRAAAEVRPTVRHRRRKRPLWDERKGRDLALTPPEFIQKYFAEEIAAGSLHRGVIYSEDRGLYTKLSNWLQKAANDLPPGLDLPTKSDWLARRRASKLLQQLHS